jgi:hypothetical protein
MPGIPILNVGLCSVQREFKDMMRAMHQGYKAAAASVAADAWMAM